MTLHILAAMRRMLIASSGSTNQTWRKRSPLVAGNSANAVALVCSGTSFDLLPAILLLPTSPKG